MGEIGYLFNLIFTFPIFNALMLLYHLFGDFALSIIVLTVVIKLILFPLTLQQLKSSKAMQALQPQLADIRKKYSNNQQKQLEETQRLYKEAGVNPAAGCLPLFIQLPVLYGLFFAINGLLHNATLGAINAELYPFIPHLTAFPNLNLNWFTFLNHGWYIPLGKPDPTHVLPLLAAVATFVQLRMSQPKGTQNTSAASDPSMQSMKMMQYVMPVVIFIFGLNYAAGLALYWTVSSIFQAVQQYFVTGWGSLLVAPDLLKGNTSGKSSVPATKTSEKQRETTRSERSSAPAADDTGEEGEGPIESNLRSSSVRSGAASSKRRPRSSNASARRRSTQRSRG